MCDYELLKPFLTPRATSHQPVAAQQPLWLWGVSICNKKKSIGPVAKLLNFVGENEENCGCFFLTFTIIKLHFLGGLQQQNTVGSTGIVVIIILVSFCTLLVIGFKHFKVFYVPLPVVLDVILPLTVLGINLFFSPSPLHDKRSSSPPVSLKRSTTDTHLIVKVTSEARCCRQVV